MYQIFSMSDIFHAKQPCHHITLQETSNKASYPPPRHCQLPSSPNVFEVGIKISKIV